MLARLISLLDTDRPRQWSRWGNRLRLLPFWGMHLGCLGVLAVGVQPAYVLLALGVYALQMFAITAFYHRYFSHRAFRTSRPLQFLFALLGNLAVQRGALWWAAHHRMHHRHSDQAADRHSPVQGSLWHSHIGWLGNPQHFATDYRLVRDLAVYPELRFLNRFDWLPPLFAAGLLFALGGWAWLVWGFCIATVACYHATFSINSLAHRWGRRRFATQDQSRNNACLALLTFGEGWHNNHHRFPAAARQGFYWWEWDLSYLLLRLLAASGLIWQLRPVPERVLAEGRSCA